MADYILSCESTADLSKEHFESRDIKYICFHFEIDGQDCLDDLGATIPFEEFYKRVADGAMTRTSQINIDEYISVFTQYVESGKDVVHVSLSSGISGTVNSAKNAAEIVMEKYPDRKIFVVDSLAASSGYGLLIDKAADLRDGGMGAAELAQWLDDNKKRLHHWFFSTDLTCYVRGGRVSKAAGVVGGIFEICPLLNVDYLGRLIVREKVRTKKKVIERIVEKMKENADDGLDYSGKCYMSNSACYDDARAVADLVEADFKNLDGDVLINWIGTTIGSHTGPGTVALFFWGKERVD